MLCEAQVSLGVLVPAVNFDLRTARGEPTERDVHLRWRPLEEAAAPGAEEGVTGECSRLGAVAHHVGDRAKGVTGDVDRPNRQLAETELAPRVVSLRLPRDPPLFS